MISTAENGVAHTGQARNLSGTASVDERPPTFPFHGLLLVAAVAGALFAQGGYYPAAHWPVAVLLGGALIMAVRAHPLSPSDLRFAPLAACAALAAWAAARAAALGDITLAMGTVAMLAGLAATVVVARRTPDADGLDVAAVGLGVVVAMTGWLGVAWRISPWALEDQGLWRAATTVTYANAAAGVLAALALLALGRRIARPGSWPDALAVCVLLTGLGASMSRGGILAAAVGAVGLAALVGVGTVVRAAVAPVLGASGALAALVPSMPATSSPSPALAAVGLVAGLALTGWLALHEGRRRVAPVAVLAPLLCVVVIFGAGWPAAAAVRQARFTVTSPDRVEALRVAVRLTGEHPVVGTGPGQAALSWVAADGRTLVARYAHNEYVQLMVELGAVGLALLLALLVTVAQAVRHGRRTQPSLPLWAGATAGLTALAVGSGLDFLWHVPAVPLVGALLVGITVPKAKENTQP